MSGGRRRQHVTHQLWFYLTVLRTPEHLEGGPLGLLSGLSRGDNKLLLGLVIFLAFRQTVILLVLLFDLLILC